MEKQKQKKHFFEITVKAVVINDKNEVLIVKRPKEDKYGGGKWDLPGGKLEEGEYLHEGLCREIKEELGIEVEIETILLVNDFGEKYDKKYKIGEEGLLVAGKGLRFLVKYKSGEIVLSSEHEKYEWLSLDEAILRFGESDFEKDKKDALISAKKYVEMKESEGKWKRAVADFENYKKREAESKRELIAFSNINLIGEILPVVDNFHASTVHIPKDQKDGAWVTGIMHIQSQLEKILEDNGVGGIAVKKGDKFDPRIMEAISDSNDSNKHSNDSNKVKKVLQRGYKIDGRVIRAARVTVE